MGLGGVPVVLKLLDQVRLQAGAEALHGLAGDGVDERAGQERDDVRERDGEGEVAYFKNC